MYRVWFNDLEKALAAFRAVVKADLFCSIEGNACGDFIFRISEDEEYIVTHKDFAVWKRVGDWRSSRPWELVSGEKTLDKSPLPWYNKSTE